MWTIYYKQSCKLNFPKYHTLHVTISHITRLSAVLNDIEITDFSREQ